MPAPPVDTVCLRCVLPLTRAQRKEQITLVCICCADFLQKGTKDDCQHPKV